METLKVGRFEIAGGITPEGCIDSGSVEFVFDAYEGEESTYITKYQAEEIISHLQKVFGLKSDLATEISELKHKIVKLDEQVDEWHDVAHGGECNCLDMTRKMTTAQTKE